MFGINGDGGANGCLLVCRCPYRWPRSTSSSTAQMKSELRLLGWSVGSLHPGLGQLGPPFKVYFLSSSAVVLRGCHRHRRPGQEHAGPQRDGGSCPSSFRGECSFSPERFFHQDKILLSGGKGGSVTVTNDGATILKAIGVDNPAAKVLVGE